MNARSIAYWITTGLLAFAMLSGGAAYLARVPATVAGVVLLGYPVYFVTLLGVWKVLGGIAILAPGFPRVKEWAYAGIFFDVSAAIVSHAAVGDFGPYAFHIVVNAVFLGVLAASWWLRPPSRRF